jgi:hypothetical protein
MRRVAFVALLLALAAPATAAAASKPPTLATSRTR